MNYPPLVFPTRFTSLTKTSDTLTYFQETPLTVVLFTLDHIDSYDSLVSTLSTYAGQVRWLLTHDPDHLESLEFIKPEEPDDSDSDDQDVLSPVLLLCRDVRHLKSSLRVYEYAKQFRPYVVLVTTPEIALRNAEQLRGVFHCSNNPDIDLSVQALTTTLLTPVMVPSIIGVDYADIAGLITGKEGRMLLATGQHESDPLAAINEALVSLKNRLLPKPKAKYVIGYLSHNSEHALGLAEFKMFQDGLYELFGSGIDNILTIMECEDDGVYCGVMVVV